jgi:hypothetical protein
MNAGESGFGPLTHSSLDMSRNLEELLEDLGLILWHRVQRHWKEGSVWGESDCSKHVKIGRKLTCNSKTLAPRADRRSVDAMMIVELLYE